MKKYKIIAGMTLFLALAAAQLAWAGGYVVVGPRAPAVVYVPGPFYAPILVPEPPLLGPYGYGYGYGRYPYGYRTHGRPYYNHHGYGYRGAVPSRSGWGSPRGGWGRR